MDQNKQMTVWLGPVELTAAQRDRFAACWDEIGDRYPDADDQDERDAARSAAVQYLLGETTPVDAGRALDDARTKLATTLAATKQIAVMAMAEPGASEQALARQLMVTRRTVRQWQGKGKGK